MIDLRLFCSSAFCVSFSGTMGRDSASFADGGGGGGAAFGTTGGAFFFFALSIIKKGFALTPADMSKEAATCSNDFFSSSFAPRAGRSRSASLQLHAP